MEETLSQFSRQELIAAAPRIEPLKIPGRAPVPVTLLTGFLGAGKTTLLNRILTGDHGLRVGVLVNDFGAVNIDAALVGSVAEHTINLANGCVCCEVRDDLVSGLESLLTSNTELDHVILEASGVADPAGVVMTFLDARYRDLLRLDSITCLVDAEGIFAQADDEALTGLKLRQVAFADLVILNKTDLVSPDHVQVARDWIGLHLNRVRIIETQHGDAPLDVLLGTHRVDVQRVSEQAETGDEQHPAFERWHYKSPSPFDRALLQEMVKRRLPASVLRCKGVIEIGDDPRPHALQVVGRRIEVTPLSPEESQLSGNVVAIGQGLDPDELTALFESCHSSSTNSLR